VGTDRADIPGIAPSMVPGISPRHFTTSPADDPEHGHPEGGRAAPARPARGRPPASSPAWLDASTPARSTSVGQPWPPTIQPRSPTHGRHCHGPVGITIGEERPKNQGVLRVRS
jgi:hypothetical protein